MLMWVILECGQFHHNVVLNQSRYCVHRNPYQFNTIHRLLGINHHHRFHSPLKSTSNNSTDQLSSSTSFDSKSETRDRLYLWDELYNLANSEQNSEYSNANSFHIAFHSKLESLFQLEKQQQSNTTNQRDESSSSISLLALRNKDFLTLNSILPQLSKYPLGSIKQREFLITRFLVLYDALETRLTLARQQLSNNSISKYYSKKHNTVLLPDTLQFSHPRSLLYTHPRYQRRSHASSLLHFIPQNSVVWNALRQRVHFSASSIGSALGFYEPSASKVLGIRNQSRVNHIAALTAWMNARNPKKSVSIKHSTQSKLAMNWGSNHEVNVILDTLKLFPDLIIREIGFVVVSKNQIVIGASPDGLMIDVDGETVLGVVEVKSRCGYRQLKGGEWEWWPVQPAEYVDVSYYAQVQIQMECCNVNTAVLVSHVIGNVNSVHPKSKMNVYRILRCEKWIHLACEILNDFYTCFVITGVPPPVDYFYDNNTYIEFLNLTKSNLENIQKTHAHVSFPTENTKINNETQ